MSTIIKGQIAKSDFNLWDGSNTTFTRSTITGGSETLNRIDWNGVDILQVYGNGETKTEGTISAALAAIGTTNVTRVFLAPGTWTISSDADYSAYTNIIWDIQPGAVFSITAAKTLTLYTDNNIIANSGQTIASGAGTIAFSVPILRFKVDSAEQVTIQDGKIEPTTDNDLDLGSTSKGLKDIHFEGSIYQAGVEQPIGKPEACFSASLSSQQANIAINTSVTVLFATEIFDKGNDYNTGTYQFTAPVTGVYHFNVSVGLGDVDSAASYYTVNLVTNNRSYQRYFDPGSYLSSDGDLSISFSEDANMTAGHVAYVTVYQSGGTQQTDIEYSSGGTSRYSLFSGHLVYKG